MPGEAYYGGFYYGGEGLRLFPAPPPPEPEPEAPPPSPPGPAPTVEVEEGLATLNAKYAYQLLGPLARPDSAHGFALRALCNAFGEMLREPEEAVRAKEEQDAWTQTFDVNRAPGFMLPFLGMMTGTLVRAGTSVAEMRAQVKEESAQKRGRPSAIIAAVQSTLTGTKRVRLVERASTAWQILVITLPGETPNVPLTEAVGRAAKPGGDIMIFQQSSLPFIDEAKRTINAGAGTIDTATIAQVT